MSLSAASDRRDEQPEGQRDEQDEGGSPHGHLARRYTVGSRPDRQIPAMPALLPTSPPPDASPTQSTRLVDASARSWPVRPRLNRRRASPCRSLVVADSQHCSPCSLPQRAAAIPASHAEAARRSSTTAPARRRESASSATRRLPRCAGRTSSSRSSASTSPTTPSRAGAPWFPPAVGERATRRTPRSTRCVACPAGWARCSFIMGGYDDPSYNFGSAVDAVMAEAARQGIPTVMWLTLRSNVSYVGPGGISYSAHVPRHQPDPDARRRSSTARDCRSPTGRRTRRTIRSGSTPTASTSGPPGPTSSPTYIANQADRVLAGQIITPPAGQARPSAPRSLTAAVGHGVGSGRVRLTWRRPALRAAVPITDYVIQRSCERRLDVGDVERWRLHEPELHGDRPDERGDVPVPRRRPQCRRLGSGEQRRHGDARVRRSRLPRGR